jgi:hypothetical protein
MAYVTDTNTFSSCLPTVGWVNNSNTRYYSIGWGGAEATCGQNGSQSCALAFPPAAGVNNLGAACTAATIPNNLGPGPNTYAYWGNAKANSGSPSIAQGITLPLNLSTITSSNFIVSAHGNISSSNIGWDLWTIGDTKSITNDWNGL